MFFRADATSQSSDWKKKLAPQGQDLRQGRCRRTGGIRTQHGQAPRRGLSSSGESSGSLEATDPLSAAATEVANGTPLRRGGPARALSAVMVHHTCTCHPSRRTVPAKRQLDGIPSSVSTAACSPPSTRSATHGEKSFGNCACTSLIARGVRSISCWMMASASCA